MMDIIQGIVLLEGRGLFFFKDEALQKLDLRIITRDLFKIETQKFRAGCPYCEAITREVVGNHTLGRAKLTQTLFVR